MDRSSEAEAKSFRSRRNIVVTGGFDDEGAPLKTVDTQNQVWKSPRRLLPMLTLRASHRLVTQLEVIICDCMVWTTTPLQRSRRKETEEKGIIGTAACNCLEFGSPACYSHNTYARKKGGKRKTKRQPA